MEHSGNDGQKTALRHALGWLVVGNSVGFYLALLLWIPSLQLGALTYGRWVPVHLNSQLYGWTSLPLVAWLFSIYEVDQSRARAWAGAAVWAWSAALGIGALHWLGGITAGKIFLDWKAGALAAFMVAQTGLWVVMVVAWRERSASWSRARRIGTLLGLFGLAMVPASLFFASSPAVYPPIDRSTGGPTGASLQGSALIVVGLMLMLPRVTAVARTTRKNLGIWVFFGVSWVVFGVTEAMGGTHRDAHQIGAMLMLLPWVWWIPRDWSGFSWPEGSRIWRRAMFGWWGLLVISGLTMYQAGILDHIKFTQGLVAHSHLAMAGFTTSFCALMVVLLSGRPIGREISVGIWLVAALGMIVTLAWMGWREGQHPSWMLANPPWREAGLAIRAGFGALMLGVSIHWWKEARR